MRRTFTIPIMMVALLGFKVQAKDRIELDPGLYAFRTVIFVDGKNLAQEPYEYCLFKGINSRTFDEIIMEISGGGNCDVTNAQIGVGIGSADVSCPTSDVGFAMVGKVMANYTATSYSATVMTKSPMGGAEVIVKTTANRIMNCPKGWTPPEGVSHK